MTVTRGWWERLRDDLDVDARESKMSQEAVLRLSEVYASLDDRERRIVNPVLSEWLSSDDSGKRYDARYLISVFRIAESLPALIARERQLSVDEKGGSAYEHRRIEEIIGLLTGCVDPDRGR